MYTHFFIKSHFYVFVTVLSNYRSMALVDITSPPLLPVSGFSDTVSMWKLWFINGLNKNSLIFNTDS